MSISSIQSYQGISTLIISTTSYSLPYTTNLELWLDASNSSTLTLSGSNIIQWQDKSGNSRHANVFVGTPTLVSSGINNQSVVYTTKSNYLLSNVASGTFKAIYR